MIRMSYDFGVFGMIQKVYMVMHEIFLYTIFSQVIKQVKRKTRNLFIKANFFFSHS